MDSENIMTNCRTELRDGEEDRYLALLWPVQCMLHSASHK